MARSPWLVPVTALRRTTGLRQPEHRCGVVGRLAVAGSVVPATAEADADLVLDVIVGGIEVSGTVGAPWTGECRRCLRPVSGRLEATVRELYRPPPRPVVGGDEAEDDFYPLVGEQLDLAPLVRDALLLDLPLAPLCRPDCPGLCPLCGAARAEGPCSCDVAPTDPRWGALDALRPRGQG